MGEILDSADRPVQVPPRPGAGSPILTIVLAGLFASLTYVLGLLAIVKLNLEAKTITIFLAGVLIGPLPGALTGVLAMLLHQALNQLGPADPLFCAAQGLAWALAGASGGWMARPRSRVADAPGVGQGPPSRARADRPLGFAAAGLALTLVYHLLTDLAESVAFGVSFWVFFAGGFVPPFFFTPLHLASNAVLFGLVVPALLPFFERLREDLLRR